jgi:hypothetical protein
MYKSYFSSFVRNCGDFFLKLCISPIFRQCPEDPDKWSQLQADGERQPVKTFQRGIATIIPNFKNQF